MISKNTLHLLEYDRLLEIISETAHSDISRQAVLDINPMASLEDVKDRFNLVDDLRNIYRLGLSLPFQHFDDITPFLEFVRPHGAVLDAMDISAFIPVLSMAHEIRLLIDKSEHLSCLPDFVHLLTGHPDLLNFIVRSVDSGGNILDSASSELLRIRRELKRLERTVQKRLEEIIKDESVAVFLQDDFITKRSGRPVIPVRMDSKGMVPGVVHDISKSGDTAFIEPLEIIHLSNELENLAAEEKAEELRILHVISGKIREMADSISDEFKIIVMLDMLNCIAIFADRLKCESPTVSAENFVRLVSARHPILELSFEKSGGNKRVVPLDIELGGENSIMVITGSNAGGKTIAIKTVGLLVCMALSGIPIPADQTSNIPFIKDMLVDIGDEQSIENSLSTFSAHVTNLARILNISGSGTLVLIDELGTGTDPDEGTALACAILRELQNIGALVFASTHLIGIKGYVHRSSGMINASMEFDNKTLMPLYRLKIGEPGRSHALDVAARYGMPERVIRAARELLDKGSAEFDELLAELNRKRADYESRLEDISIKEADIKNRSVELKKLLEQAEAESKSVIAEAHREASDILSDVKRMMNIELDRLKKMERHEIRKRLREIQAMQKAAAEKVSSYDEGSAAGLKDIKTGETVYVKSLACEGVVVGIMEKDRKVRITAEGKEIIVPVSGIKQGARKTTAPDTPSLPAPYEDAVSSKVNLIGMRVDEAISVLEPFLNHASLAGYREVTIIHGFGTGALRRGVREHLTSHPLVEYFRDGDPAEGGAGITIVVLR